LVGEADECPPDEVPAATFELVSVPMQNQAGSLHGLLYLLTKKKKILVHGLTVVPNGDVASIRMIVDAPRDGGPVWPKGCRSIRGTAVVAVEVYDDIEFLGACRALRHGDVNIESVLPLFAPGAAVVMMGLNLPTELFDLGVGSEDDIPQACVTLRRSVAKRLSRLLPLNDGEGYGGAPAADYLPPERGDPIIPECALHGELILHIEDRVGSLFEACDVLAKADIRIWSARVEGKPPEAFLRLLVANVKLAVKAFEAAEMEVFRGRVFPFDLKGSLADAQIELLALVAEISSTKRNDDQADGGAMRDHDCEPPAHEGGIDITDMYPLMLPPTPGTIGKVAFVVSKRARVRAVESLMGAGFRIL
jgi:hypothetical protein